MSILVASSLEDDQSASSVVRFAVLKDPPDISQSPIKEH